MTIEIEDLIFDTIIGLLDFERVVKQRVIVNLKASYNYSKGKFINYVELRDLIIETMNSEKFELLEEALKGIGDLILDRYRDINTLELKITKPDILDNCQVSLSRKWG